VLAAQDLSCRQTPNNDRSRQTKRRTVRLQPQLGVAPGRRFSGLARWGSPRISANCGWAIASLQAWAVLQLLLGSLSCGAIAVALLALVRGRQGCALLLGVHVGLMTMGASVRAWSLLLSASEFSREELARMSVYGLGFAFLVYVLIALTHRLWSPI
jgi:hypothetical protein